MDDRSGPGAGRKTPTPLLLIEDDVRLASLTAEYLEKNGFSVSRIATGKEGLKRALREKFEILLLDLMLPDLGGIELCRKLREHSDIPIIMLTARGEEADRVLGLETGADDYMPKPFSPRELLARINALLRRYDGRSGPEAKILTVGDLVLDPGGHRATLGGVPLDLTPYEFLLLTALAGHPGRVLSRDRLLDMIRGQEDESFDRSIDVHISRLRHKLGDDARRPRRIRTIRGAGYQYLDGDGTC